MQSSRIELGVRAAIEPRPPLRLAEAPWAAAAEVSSIPVAGEPDWVREAVRKYAARLRDWLTQSWALTLRPERFAAEWGSGKREALNPVRFLAIGTTVQLLADHGGRWLLHMPAAAHTRWLSGSMASMFNLAVIGALMHVVLRWKSGVAFRSSVAASVFAIGGPGAIAAVSGWTLSAAIRALFGRVPSVTLDRTEWPIPVLALITLSYAWLLRTQAGVHRTRWWAPVLAMLVSGAVLAAGSPLLRIIAGFAGKKLGF